MEVCALSLVFYLGVDVSKRTLSVNLKDPSKENVLWTNKSLPNDEKGFAQIAETAAKKIAAKGYAAPFEIAIGMESTGVYGERLAYYFHDRREEGFRVYILNPAAVRSFAKAAMTKNKNDAVDAHIIASYLSVAIPQGIVRAWVPPKPEESRLRDLSKRREELVHLRTQEENRLEKLHEQLHPPATVVNSVESVIEHVRTEIRQIEKEISLHIDKHPGLKGDVDLMRSIPGIGDIASVVIESETGGLSNFANVRQLVAYAGLSPEEYSSGTSVYRRSRISKRGNKRLRCVLYMSAMVACRLNPVVKRFYERLLAQGKGKKVAIVACMRKLLHIVWGVVKNKKIFNASYT